MTPEEELTLRRYGLDAESVKAKLLFASLFLAAYEALREVVVVRTQHFFADEWTAEGPNRSAAYKRRILDPHPNAFVGSVSWLREMEVLSTNDEVALERMRDQRNSIAHDLPGAIFGEEAQIDLELMNTCRELVIRIGRFWARIDLETDEEFDERDIADEDIQPGIGIMLEYIVQIAADAIAPNP